MNIRAVNAALAIKTGSPKKKAVLWALANRANESGVCWPEQQNISDQTEWSVDTIQKSIKELVDDGLISRTRRNGAGGERRSDIYVLSSALLQSDTEAKPYTAAGGVGAEPTPLPAARLNRLQRFSNEPSIEPSIKKESWLSFFDEFFAIFPDRKAVKKSETKKPARIEYERRIKEGADPHHINADAREYAEQQRYKDPTFTAKPQNWLRDWSYIETPVRRMVTHGTPEWDQLRANYVRLGRDFIVAEMDRFGQRGKPFPVIQLPVKENIANVA
jgi:DNA-binding MarR family transcriptional regulator